MSAQLIFVSLLFLVIGIADAQNTDDSDGRKETSRMDLAVRFKQFDKNNNGKLTLDELSSGFASVPLGRRPSGAQLNQGGGSTNPPQNQAGPSVMSAAEFFKSADTNYDDELSVDEFTSMIEKLRESARSSGGMGG